MKLISKFFLGLGAIALLTLVSCNKDDDQGPSTPENPGIFKGSFINPKDGATSEWVATSTKADHDTLSGELRIRASNAAGDVIMILLSSTEPGVYSLFQNTTNESTYKTSAQTAIATTRTNDVPTATAPKESKIQITDKGDTDGIIKGIVHSLQWYIVGEEIADDERVGIFNTGTFEIPLTRGANMSGSGQANITAKINGATFNPTVIQAFGLTLMAASIDHSLTISLPSNATLGEHDFGGMSMYTVSYSSGEALYSTTGTLNLLEFNSIAGTATGTFEGTATPMGGGDNISITAGTFRY